jgi:hypothetical protein
VYLGLVRESAYVRVFIMSKGNAKKEAKTPAACDNYNFYFTLALRYLFSIYIPSLHFGEKRLYVPKRKA